MSASPTKKRPISEFFKPYTKSTVPTKRPSPSLEEAEEIKEANKSPSRDVAKTGTPKKETLSRKEPIRTPTSSALSPLSAPGSRASLPIRSPHPGDLLEPPSTYKRAPRFDTDRRAENTPKQAAKSFSFADLPASTQAVVKDGEVIEILDSDDDDTDSLVSLESLDDLLGRKKGDRTASLSSSPEEDEVKLEAKRVKTLSLFTRGRSDPLVGRDKLRALFAKERAHQFDLSKLIGDHFDDEEVEQNVQKARADVEASTKAVAATENPPTLDKNLLAAVAIEDGEDGISRLMDAVDRTEALTSEKVFLFFGVNGLNDWHDDDPYVSDFPESAIPEKLWHPGDNESRSRAFMSGYMSELAAKGLTQDKALGWVFDTVVLEQQDEVRQAYIDCLRNASPTWTRTNVTAHDVQTVFQTLGADATSIQDSVEIQPRHGLVKDPERRNPKYLLAALELFQAICADMDFVALSKLTSVVCRLAIDAEVMSDCQVSAKVERVLEVLLSLPDSSLRSHVAERVLTDVGHHLKDATLQARLLAHILPTSNTASRLRILLAQTFLLSTCVLKSKTSLTPTILLDTLTSHITQSPSFDTRRRRGPSTLDYIALRSLTAILDVAISDGGRPATFLSRAAEQLFNRSVDHLADAIKATFVSIIDSGASHMSRTEAKDVLHALHWRLLYSVRTEVRPKRNIFDGKTGRLRDGEAVRTEEKGRGFMEKFLAKKRETDMSRTVSIQEDRSLPISTPSGSSSSSSERSETEKLIRRQLELSE